MPQAEGTGGCHSENTGMVGETDGREERRSSTGTEETEEEARALAACRNSRDVFWGLLSAAGIPLADYLFRLWRGAADRRFVGRVLFQEGKKQQQEKSNA